MPPVSARNCSSQSLYVHVPFCARKCAYCAFYSDATIGQWAGQYVAALVRELELVAAELKPATVFFGGGTPTLLNLRQWQAVLKTMERLELLGADEWTVECNPATVSLDKARLLREYGVNRISMGVQSLDNHLLERLGRIHTRTMVFKSFDLLRKAGFDNINLDLMFAIPGQTMPMWRATLDEAMRFGSEHVSSYEVIYEEDTPLFHQLQSGAVRTDEDLACSMYEELVERTGTAGYRQYEIANFARDSRTSDGVQAGPDGAAKRRGSLPAFACRHNVNYWRGGAFHGVGPSATSYVSGTRSKNVSNTRLYCERLAQGLRAFESEEKLSPLARAGETAAFGLRMVSGWSFAEFMQVTGYDLRRDWSDDMAQLCRRGWGAKTRSRFHLTDRGLRFADAAAEMFLR